MQNAILAQHSYVKEAFSQSRKNHFSSWQLLSDYLPCMYNLWWRWQEEWRLLTKPAWRHAGVDKTPQQSTSTCSRWLVIKHNLNVWFSDEIGLNKWIPRSSCQSKEASSQSKDPERNSSSDVQSLLLPSVQVRPLPMLTWRLAVFDEAGLASGWSLFTRLPWRWTSDEVRCTAIVFFLFVTTLDEEGVELIYSFQVCVSCSSDSFLHYGV